MSKKPQSPSPILILTIIAITIAVTVTASPTTTDPDFILLPSDDESGSTTSSSSSSICPISLTPGASCPVKCFRPSPVCGIDNVTYWCGCPEAVCAGVPVAKLGFCDHQNGSGGPVSGQALLLVHIVWLIFLGFFVLFGLL